MSFVMLKDLNLRFKEAPLDVLFSSALAAVVFFIPFKIGLSNIFTGVATIFWILNCKNNFSGFEKRLIIPIIIFTSLYIVQIFGMIYTDNLNTGFSLLEKKLGLLIFPVIIIISGVQRSHLKFLEYTLITSVTLASLICHYYTIKEIIVSHLPWRSLVFDDRFHNVGFTNPLGIHPAYLSLFICLALLIIYIDFKNLSIYGKVLSIVMISYLLATQLQLVARAGLFALMAVAIIVIIYQALQSQKVIVFWILSSTIVLLVYLALTFIPEVKLRMVDSLKNMSSAMYDNDQISSPGLHVKSWYCAIQSWKEGNILFGYGTGDEKNVLKHCYADHQWFEMVKEEYDSHNEYLSNLVRHGLLGLFLWLFCLLYSLYLSLRNFDFVYLSFIILISIAAFSESILRGQTVLVFYALFNSLYFKTLWLNVKSASE